MAAAANFIQAGRSAGSGGGVWRQRTASRTFVLTGSGPNGADKSAAAATSWSLANVIGDTRVVDGLDNAAVKSRFGIDLDQVPVKELEALTARMR